MYLPLQVFRRLVRRLDRALRTCKSSSLEKQLELKAEKPCEYEGNVVNSDASLPEPTDDELS